MGFISDFLLHVQSLLFLSSTVRSGEVLWGLTLLYVLEF